MVSRDPGAAELPFPGDKIKRADLWRTKVPVCICRPARPRPALFVFPTINSTLVYANTHFPVNDDSRRGGLIPWSARETTSSACSP